MRDKIRKYTEEINSFRTSRKEELEDFRIRYLSKKGIIPGLFSEFKDVPADQRRDIGLMLNELKNTAQEKFDQILHLLEAAETVQKPSLDLTLPADFMETGSRHPVSIIWNEIIAIFSRIGFTVAEGPDIEDDWHNFSALNFQEEHPARDMQDTFFLQEQPAFLLRTHTSSVQIRTMEKTRPPIRALFPGRVYRNEAISARAHCLFHQVEGLYVDRHVSFADLKQTLLYFAREMFGENTGIRLRPSFFPFTEPSAEMDISCFLCGGKGCRICKGTGWVEILGCGMVDPAVLDNCGINSTEYTGFAFGMGIERIAILRYQINDIRLFFENDIRFLRQFRSAL
ncbi:MAG TPA: phenylalanine--tRNA ligase subunit alpha [Bacteroidales bacterium]|nr:phenylalanine--tRNA ligase subunit alpha [Bacteroidales bacterium]